MGQMYFPGELNNNCSAEIGKIWVEPENVNPASNPQNNSFLLIVHDVFHIKGRGPVVQGKIEKGTISNGCSLNIIGNGQTLRAICKGIEHNGQLVDSAHIGDVVGLLLSGVTYGDVHGGQKVVI